MVSRLIKFSGGLDVEFELKRCFKDSSKINLNNWKIGVLY